MVRIFGVTGFYHRYFSHRTYKTSRSFQFVLASGATCVQKGPLWWSANHRHHHGTAICTAICTRPGCRASSGRTSAGSWARLHETDIEKVPDLARYPELRWLNTWHLVPAVTLAVLFLIGGIPGLIWGFFVSTVLCWHATFIINSLTHMFGRRRYMTRDDSRNSLILALITLGEGWHNNHHYYQSSTRQGFFWWEIDLSYYVLGSRRSWVSSGTCASRHRTSWPVDSARRRSHRTGPSSSRQTVHRAVSGSGVGCAARRAGGSL